MHASARRGDLEGVKTMVVDFQEDVNSVDMHGMTALHYSSKRGHTQIVEYLLSSRASVETRNAISQTPLFTASQAGKLEAAEILLANKADPNATGDHGIRPIHRAAMAGHDEVVRMLLRHGADPLVVDEFMMEGAIHLASREGHAEVIRTIMGVVPRQTEEGIGQEEKSQQDHGRWGMMEEDPKHRTRKRRLDDGNSRGETALHLAAMYGKADCVTLLLRMGSTDRWRSWYMGKQEGTCMDTALHKACQSGHAPVVRLLLDHRANPTTANVIGRTPLHLAISSSDPLVATYLLRAGADLMAVDHDGRRPAGAGSGPWLNSRAVPPTIQSQLQDIEKAESRGGRRPKYPTMQNASNEPDMSPAADAARSMVKMQLADVGGGVSAERQAFTTRTRMELARGRRQEARRVAKVIEEDEVGIRKIQQEALARAKRILTHRLDAERAEIEAKMRRLWAQKIVATWWRAYKAKMEEERRMREKAKRKADADKARREQEELLRTRGASFRQASFTARQASFSGRQPSFALKR